MVRHMEKTAVFAEKCLSVETDRRVQPAARVLRDVATFDSGGVSGAKE
jgi:hypothetical protein